MPDDLAVPPKATSHRRATTLTWAILIVACDTVCGIALLLLACVLAGLLRHLTPFDYPDLYIVWFTIGTIPFALFAHWRGALALKWRVVAVLTPALLVLPFVPMTVLDRPGGWMLYPIAIALLAWLGERLSALVLPERSGSRNRRT